METTMQSTIRNFILGCVLIIAGIQFSGCSLFGYLIGSAADRGTPDRDTVSMRNLSGINRNDDIILRHNDGLAVEGTFEAIETMSDTAYAALYTNRTAQIGTASHSVPEIGEHLVFENQRGETRNAEFFGFDYGNTIVLKQSGHAGNGRLPMENLHSIRDTAGNIFDTAGMMKNLREGNIPFRSTAQVTEHNRMTSEPLDDIDHIEKKNSKNGKWVGFGIGLAIDAVAVAVAIGFGEAMTDAFTAPLYYRP